MDLSGSGWFFQSVCGALIVGLHDSQPVCGPTVDLKGPDRIESICMSLFGLDSQSAVESGPSVTGALSEPAGPAVARVASVDLDVMTLVVLWGPRWVWRALSQTMEPQKAWITYISTIVDFSMSQSLGISVDQWALGECEIFREPGWISVGLWGPLWVCGPVENPDGSQLVCGALSVYVGHSMNLAGSQSVCASVGPQLFCGALRKPLWLSASMWAFCVSMGHPWT